MNPYAILAAVVLAGAALGGSYWQGRQDGRDACQAAAARDDAVRQKTLEAAQQGAAQAISKIEVQNVTIRQRVEREIREKPVYRDCRHTPGGLRGVNAALTGDDPEPAGSGQLPAASASDR